MPKVVVNFSLGSVVYVYYDIEKVNKTKGRDTQDVRVSLEPGDLVVSADCLDSYAATFLF